MSLRNNFALNGLAPKKYTEMRTVYSEDGLTAYHCFYQRSGVSSDPVFISGIESVSYADGRDKLHKLFISISSEVESLLSAQTWE